MIRTLLVFGGVLVAWAAAQAPSSIFGRYVKSCTPSKGVSCRPTADSMTVSRKAGGKVGVAIRLVYAAGHTCQMQGVSEWKDNSVTLEGEGVEDDKPCRLKISFQSGKAVLQDEGSRCTPVYCGTRGTFHGVTFQKPAPVGTKRK